MAIWWDIFGFINVANVMDRFSIHRWQCLLPHSPSLSQARRSSTNGKTTIKLMLLTLNVIIRQQWLCHSVIYDFIIFPYSIPAPFLPFEDQSKSNLSESRYVSCRCDTCVCMCVCMCVYVSVRMCSRYDWTRRTSLSAIRCVLWCVHNPSACPASVLSPLPKSTSHRQIQ